MKNLFTLLLVGALTLVSCSKDEDGPSNDRVPQQQENFFRANAGDWQTAVSITYPVSGRFDINLAYEIGWDTSDSTFFVDPYASLDGACYTYLGTSSVGTLSDSSIVSQDDDLLVIRTTGIPVAAVFPSDDAAYLIAEGITYADLEARYQSIGNNVISIQETYSNPNTDYIFVIQGRFGRQTFSECSGKSVSSSKSGITFKGIQL